MTPSPAARLEYRDLTDADLRRDLRGARLRGSRLLDVDLRGADLRGADLRGVLAQWTATSLDGARLDGCDLRDADFSGVDAQAATFEAADLEGSRWDRADLRGARLAGARLGWHSIWLANVAAGREGGQPASFDDADLREADLTGIQLPGASLRRADLRGARAGGAVLTGTQLTGANLASANLSGADLCEADLREAVLDGADLRGAALLGARLIGTRIDGTVFDGARLGGTVLAGLSGAGPQSATGVVHLAPNVADGTVPAQLCQPVTAGDAGDRDTAAVTCLLAGENADEHFQRTRRALGAARLKCYAALPHSLSSPAGPVVAARACAGHALCVAVAPPAGIEPAWLHPIRRAALDQPVWGRRVLIVIRGSQLEVVGRVPEFLRGPLDAFVEKLDITPDSDAWKGGAWHALHRLFSLSGAGPPGPALSL
jgi:uncharacterized protein YjbI with pentapeptide repeats